jgi:hypothetical protein
MPDHVRGSRRDAFGWGGLTRERNIVLHVLSHMSLAEVDFSVVSSSHKLSEIHCGARGTPIRLVIEASSFVRVRESEETSHKPVSFRALFSAV